MEIFLLYTQLRFFLIWMAFAYACWSDLTLCILNLIMMFIYYCRTDNFWIITPVQLDDSDCSEAYYLFRGVCRPLDIACPTVPDNSFDKPTSPNKTISSDHVTLRIGVNTLSITEVVGKWVLLFFLLLNKLLTVFIYYITV